jgi:hypothetical protein
MHILFENIQISDELKNFLAENNISTVVERSDPFLIVYYGKKFPDDLKSQYPYSSFAQITLSDEPHDKTDFIWPLDNWERLFYLNLKQAVKLFSEKVRISKSHQELLAQTESLIKTLENNITLAENVQKAIRPPKENVLPDISLLTKFSASKTSKGGDYFDTFELEDKKMGLLLCDSNDHTTTANLLSHLIQLKNPTQIDLNLFTSKSAQLFFAILDRATLLLNFKMIGKFNFYVFRENALTKIEMISDPELKQNLQLQPNDLLILPTSGLKLDLKNIDKFLATEKDLTKIQNEIFAKSPQSEKDRTLLLVKVNAKAMFLRK